MCKKKKAYELNWKFQDTWIANLPWVKVVLNEDKLVTHVCYKICTKVMGKEKLVDPKFDSFWKHVGRKKIIPLCPMFLKLHFIMLNKDCQHAKNESLYVELEVGIMCWINICKVWRMKITWRISFNLSKISAYSKKEKPNLNMKTWRVCWNSIKWFSTKTLV